MKRRAAAIAIVLAIGASASANAAWEQPVAGPSPINVSSTSLASSASVASVDGVPYVVWTEVDATNIIRAARLNAAGTAWEKVGGAVSPTATTAVDPSLAAINGVPHVAWVQGDTVNVDVRVARLNAAGTAWEPVGEALDAASPINQSPTEDAHQPSLTAVGGVPHVAWMEFDAADNNFEIRVARLNAAGTGWDKVAGSASPINQSTTQDGNHPSLTAVAGVPYVAWWESDGANFEIRVARLNAAVPGWEKVGQVVDPASPINVSPTNDAFFPDLAAIDGVPYVAFNELDPNNEVRVARLNADGTAWDQVAGSASPINENPSENGFAPVLAAIDDVPYLSWMEEDESNIEVRVGRLNADGTAWEQVAGSASPINESSDRDASAASLMSVNGVPYVGWVEEDETNREVRVSRLEPEFVSQSVVAGSTTASLSATWHTYGLGFGVGFDYGSSLESATAPVAAPLGVDSPTVTQEVGGLSPSSVYQFRSYATAGVPLPRVQALNSTVFQTTATAADTTPPETTITKDPDNKLKGTKAKYKFTSSEPNSTFVCKFDRKKPKPCDAGKAKFKRLDDGKHKFRVYAVDAAGNEDKSPAKDKFKVL